MKIGADGEVRSDGTRDAVVRSVLERGPQSAVALAERLGLSAAGIRRHLDALVGDGLLVEREPRASTRRGRGRPARTYALTDAGRAAFPHGYDDLANTALRYLAETGGEAALTGFAENRARTLAARLTADIAGVADAPLATRADAMAASLSAHGYASTTQAVGTPDTVSGVQICQHHCPVAHVAAEFPQLCEAETRAFESVLGTYVQRLATIAHGDGVCTTHIPSSHTPSHDRTDTRTTATRSGRTTP